MKLHYFYTSEINGAKDVKIHLSSKYIFETDIKDDAIKININPNENYIENFFHKDGRIDIAGIIGENGSGKTSTLKAIMRNFYKFQKGRAKYDNDTICIFEDEKEERLMCFHNIKDRNIKFTINKNIKNKVINIIDDTNDEWKACNILTYFFQVSDDFNEVPSDNLGGINISNNGLERILEIQKLNMVNFNEQRLGHPDKRPDRIVQLYRHYSGRLMDNKYILYTNLNSDVLENYIEKKTMGIRPFSVNEFAQGDYIQNVQIENLVSQFGYDEINEKYLIELNDREFVYVVSKGIIKILETKISINDKNLISQLLTDYVILTYIKDIRYINRKLCNEFADIKNMDHFFDKFYKMIQTRIEEGDTKSLTRSFDSNGELTQEYTPDNLPENLTVFNGYVKEVQKFYKLVKKQENKKNNYYIIDISKGSGKEIANQYIDEEKSILLKYFKVINKVCEQDGKIVEYPYSSGELHMIRLFSRLYYSTDIAEEKRDSDKTLLFLLDEPDTSLHPEWQRLFWKDAIEMLSKFNQNIQILFTSHSPLLISDIPKSNLNIVSKKKEKEIETFSANIYDLYKLSFFLKKPMGEFAYDKIFKFYDDIIKAIENKKALDSNQIEVYEKLIDIVGDEILKTDMQRKMYEYKETFKDNANNFLIEQLEKVIKEKQAEIKKLKGAMGNDQDK